MTYDNNGNLTNDGTNTYNWNARNQLSSISGGATASFVYDGVGRRQKKTISASNTEFLYDGVNPVQEKDGATVLANILTGLGVDEYFTRSIPADPAATRHFLTDALGSTVALADSETTPAIRIEYTYEPFGRTTVGLEPNANPYQFTGRENDGTCLYYYRARYYHPVFQRFISEDPIEFAGGDINLYTYVGNNSINFADPSGNVAVVDDATLLFGAAILATAWLTSPQGQAAVRDLGKTLDDIINDINTFFAKPSRGSQKERATDVPEWSRAFPRKPNEKCGDYAERILKDKYGCDDPRAAKRGPGSEYSKIKKFCERGGR